MTVVDTLLIGHKSPVGWAGAVIPITERNWGSERLSDFFNIT